MNRDVKKQIEMSKDYLSIMPQGIYKDINTTTCWSVSTLQLGNVLHFQ